VTFGKIGLVKHINLYRALPVSCALAAAVYVAGAELYRGPGGDKPAFILGVVVAAVFCIKIRLGHLPWFEEKDGKAHRFILWLEEVFPGLRGPPK
jgi:hypothetical protein